MRHKVKKNQKIEIIKGKTEMVQDSNIFAILMKKDKVPELTIKY